MQLCLCLSEKQCQEVDGQQIQSQEGFGNLGAWFCFVRSAFRLRFVSPFFKEKLKYSCKLDQPEGNFRI